MSINRGPFNGLVDDDGSGRTGTPWNKQAIKDVILDPVDAALPTGAWVDVPFAPANFWSDMTTGMVLVNKYMIIGKTMWWMVRVYNSTVPNPLSPYCLMKLPGGVAAASVASPAAYAFDTPVGPVAAHLFLWDGQTIAASKTDASNWLTYPMHLYFTAVIALV